MKIIVIIGILSLLIIYGCLCQTKVKSYLDEPHTLIKSSDESGELYADSSHLVDFKIQKFTPYNIIFNNDEGETIGTLIFNDNTLSFKGNAEESAKLFFDVYLKNIVDGYIKQEIKQE